MSDATDVLSRQLQRISTDPAGNKLRQKIRDCGVASEAEFIETTLAQYQTTDHSKTRIGKVIQTTMQELSTGIKETNHE